MINFVSMPQRFSCAGTVTLKPSEQLQVTLRMQMEFEGKFTVKALDPTTFAAYCTLDLETDYLG